MMKKTRKSLAHAKAVARFWKEVGRFCTGPEHNDYYVLQDVMNSMLESTSPTLINEMTRNTRKIFKRQISEEL